MKRILFQFLAIAAIGFLAGCQNGSSSNSGEQKNAEQPAVMVEKAFSIKGMHCDMCVASIEKGVSQVEGVQAVTATLNDSTAVVRFDQARVDLADIEKAIEKRGYSVKEVHSH